MTRSLQKIGNSKGIVLTRVMLEHLGVTDQVEVLMEKGQIVITAPQSKQPHRQSFEEAKEATFAQYDAALHRLAGAG